MSPRRAQDPVGSHPDRRRLRLPGFVLGLCVAIMAAACDVGLPGQISYKATLTVFNRTTAEVIVESGTEFRIIVPACGEVTEDGFPVNWWTLTSPGRDTFTGGGGTSATHSYLLVTSFPIQQDDRPDPLPKCEGLLQPGSRVCPDVTLPSEEPRSSEDATAPPRSC